MIHKMRTFTRLLALGLSLPALVLGGLHWLRVRSPRQVVLRTAKSAAEALAPLLALSGLAGAVLGWLVRSPAAVLAGLLGSLLAGGYRLRVMQSAHRLHPPAARPMRTHRAQPVRWLRDIPYWHLPESAEHLYCDLWLPPEAMPPSGTALLYLHGGGFFTSRKDFGTRSYFRHLAGEGHVVMDVDYRLAPGVSLIDMQADVRRAVAWMKAHAADYHVQRIVLAGGSAGGLLALLVAYTPNHATLTPPDLAESDSSVQAVVSYYGVVDLAALYHRLALVLPADARAGFLPAALFDHCLLQPAIHIGAWLKGVEPGVMRQYLRDNAALMQMGLGPAFERLLGGAPDAVPDRYRLVSPAAQVGAHCPPTLLIHGEHDHLLPVSATRALADQLRACGAPVVYLELPQTEHTFDLFLPQISPPAQAALFILDHFLASLESTGKNACRQAFFP